MPPTQTDHTYYLDDIINFYRTPPFLHQAIDNRIERLIHRNPNLAAPTHILYRTGQPPILIRSQSAADSDSDELPDLIDLSDDERNRLDRDGPNPRPHFPPPGTYDIRVATNTDDQQTDSDDEPDPLTHNPTTWYDPTLPNLPFDNRNMTQPLSTPPFLSSLEIHQWYRSQMRWRTFLNTLPERHQVAYERRPAPDIRMQQPSRPFMLTDNAHQPVHRLHGHPRQTPSL
jgi:hypothetical protein